MPPQIGAPFLSLAALSAINVAKQWGMLQKTPKVRMPHKKYISRLGTFSESFLMLIVLEMKWWIKRWIGDHMSPSQATDGMWTPLAMVVHQFSPLTPSGSYVWQVSKKTSKPSNIASDQLYKSNLQANSTTLHSLHSPPKQNTRLPVSKGSILPLNRTVA